MRWTVDAQLDFHDFKALLPYDVEQQLNEFLEDSYVRNYKQVLIITGKGKLVKPLVQKLLRNHKLVKKFEYADYYSGQEGAVVVNLK
jgi:DNA-nicking Smr family endonuclease